MTSVFLVTHWLRNGGMSLITKFKSLSNTQIKRILSLVLIIVLGAGSSAAVFGLSNDFTITDGDSVTKIRTLHNETSAVLRQAGIQVDENKDKVHRTDRANNQVDIVIKRAFTVDVFFDGEWHSFEVNDGTVADLIALHNIPAGDGFFVSAAMDEPLSAGKKIVVSRFVPVNVFIDGENRAVSVPEGTVDNALKFLQIELSPDDTVSEPLDKVVEDGLNITVNRVEIKEVTEREPINFSTEIKKSGALSRGEFKIEVAGSNGEKDVVKRIKYVDGKPADVEVLSENVLKAPVNQVKIVGTKPIAKSRAGKVSISTEDGTIVDEAGNVHRYRKVLTGVCTAYTNSKKDGGPRTSTGKIAKVGMVAVDPRVIPYGTELYVPGYGRCVAADTGGALRSGRVLLDLFMNSESECRSWGRRTKNVYVL